MLKEKMNEDKAMTVGKLIDKLKELPANVEVFIFQIIDESDGKFEFVPLDRDLSLSRRNTLELYPEHDSVLTYR